MFRYDVRRKRTASKSLNEKQKLRYKVKMERKVGHLVHTPLLVCFN